MPITEVTLLTDLKSQIGEVQANPTLNTVLDRLKTISLALSGTSNFTLLNSTNLNLIKLAIDNISLEVGLIQTSASDIDVNTTSMALKMGEVQVTPTANTELARLKDINTSLTTLTRSVTPQGFNLVTLNVNPKLVLGQNLLRKSTVIQSIPTNISPLYVGYDSSVTSSKYAFILYPNDLYTQDTYLGDIYISSATATDKISYGEV
jgi:hypothetical protein